LSRAQFSGNRSPDSKRSRHLCLRTALLTSALFAAGAAGAAQGAPAGASTVRYTETREPCEHRSATRNAFFGDLHIHTGLSYDARPLGTNTTPADAYRFARGEAIGIPPYGEAGQTTRQAQLAQPLDFAAVTDHAEFFGELAVCTDPDSGVTEQALCSAFSPEGGTTSFDLVKIILSETPQHPPSLCGEDGAACATAALAPWRMTQDMAETAYDRSENCQFTTFVGYEYTGTPNANNYHRNVIFRNASVPEQAISYIEAPTAAALRAQLQNACLEDEADCDVLIIPHNSNLSAGLMLPRFAERFAGPQEARAEAAARNALEPIMEIFQHKGNSECVNGLPGIVGGTDELCDMEQVRRPGPVREPSGTEHVVRFCEEGEVGSRGFSRIGCISRNDFYRSALLGGLEDEISLGINSYRMGAIGSTDTHLSLSGGTDERSWAGHVVDEATLEQRLEHLQTVPRRLDTNPGGLAGVWAVENSRDALFDAMQRREVFGTSGTRIRPRLFAGWRIGKDACSAADQPAYGYANGVPMGDILEATPPGENPRFLLSALRDPRGSPLQKLQLIKGWIDSQGVPHVDVIDVAGHSGTEGTLDEITGEWQGPGESALCGVYEDREFDPARPSYYYLRAVEVPSLRWSWAQCLALAESERPAACDNQAPRVIQELAWSSPVWHAPGAAAD
jgi:hypothetical protein